ncbi:MAG: hypothetical protein V1729_06190, partial [Candidatus Woesearchaeota archaeon]
LDKDILIASMYSPVDIDRLQIKLHLPEKATLKKPMNRGAIAGSAVFPVPSRLETDGQTITIVWDFSNIKAGDEIALYADYKMPSKTWPMITTILIALAVLGTALYILFKKRSKQDTAPDTEERSTTSHKPTTPHRPIDTHLKEDEQQIVNVLRLKEGSCEQGTLRIATGFSKAKLSGLLKEMEQRKMVHKEKKGKRNLVFLKG